MKRVLTSVLASLLASASIAATNLVSNTAIVTNRVQGIVTYTMSNGVARVQDPSGKLVGTAEERALKVAAEGQVDIASAAADAAGTAMEEWREFTATTDVKVCYIDAGFTQDLPALAQNLCGWVAGSFYDREKGEDHYYVWFNREIDYPPSMCARIVSESGTNWLDGTWKDWAVTNWIDKATGREFVMPTARNYVQDGLVAMWDGIENAGLGSHSESISRWKNLVDGSPDAILTNTKTFDHSIYFPAGSENGYGVFDGVVQNVRTVEAVFRFVHYDGNRGCLVNFANARYGIYGIASYYQNIRCAIDNSNQLYVPKHIGELSSAGFVFDDSKCVSAYDRGREVYSKANASLKVRCVNGINSNDPVGEESIDFHLYSLRVYNRAITSAEIANNYAIDRARFFNDNPPVPCRELVVPRRNANCVLKTGTVITLGGRDGFDADIHKVNIEVGGTPTVTTSAQLPLFYAVTRSGTNTVTRAYTNGFVNVENGFVKEPTNE